MREGEGAGAVDLDSKPGLGVGHHWGWEAADGAKGDTLKVAGCLEEVALAALMVTEFWECTAGAQAVHLLDPFAEQVCSAFDLWASLPGPRKLCSVPFCWHRIGPKGAWPEPPEARNQYRGTGWDAQGFLL
jgi:hypothetical protein